MPGEGGLQAPATAQSSVRGRFLGRLRRYRGQGRLWDAVIVLCSLLAIGIVWAVTLERIRHERAATVVDIVKQNVNLVLALEQHTVHALTSAEQALIDVGREYGAQGKKFDIAAMFRDRVVGRELFWDIGVIDERGRVVLDSVESGNATYLGDRELFRTHENANSGKMFIGRPLLGRITLQWVMPVSRRINNPDGSFGGVVFAGIDPNYFIRFYQQAELGRDGVVNLVGLDGITRARRVGDKGTFGQEMRKSTLLAMQAQAPAGSFVSRGVQEGIPRYQSYRTLPDYPLVVSVGTSQAEGLAAFDGRRRAYYLWSALGSILIALFAALQIAALARQRRAQEEVALKNTVLATQQEASLDAILVVDEGAKIVSYNRKFIDLWRIPAEMVRAGDDRPVLQTVVGQALDPEAFLARVSYLYGHREEKSSEEVQMKDGRTIDRYSSPVVGANGRYHGRIWYFRDVTERVRSEAELRKSETRFRQLAETIGEAFWMAPPDLGSMLYISPAFEKIWGRSCEELYANPGLWLDAAHPDDRAMVLRALEALAQGTPYDIEFRISGPGGAQRWINDRGYAMRDDAGRVVLTSGVASDITDRMRAEEQSRLSARAFENIADGIVVTDAEKRIVSVNPAFTTITGYPPEEILGKTPRHLQSGRHDAAFFSEMWREIGLTGHWRGEIWDRRKNGEIYPQLLSISVVKDASGAVTHYVGVSTDISSLKRYEEQLQYQASHDALTGLPNRALLQDRFRETLSRARRHDRQAAVLFLDLDRFKNINDSLGHDVGDLLLQSIAKRLTAGIREVDTAARFGGDEFAVLLDIVDGDQGVATVAQKLLDAMSAPFQLAGNEVYMSVSIGISCFPQDGADAETLLKNADTAMYLAKTEGRNKYQFFSADMNARALENLQMSNSLRLALQRDELLLYYQPQYDLKSGRITGAEALVRWQHPELGLIPPYRFIPLAEETGLIEPIGEWVLETACKQMRAWRDAGLPLDRMAVNLSARQFRNPVLVQRIAAVLEETGLPAHQLELEVTESMVMHNPENAAGVLARLKAMGISIAIDDFGTGYSSLSYLKRFPINYLKIDQSFVSGVPDDADDAAIIQAIIAMAKSLNLRLIAEGVETEGQRAFLEKHGCDEGQGYLFSRPVSADDCAALMRLNAPVRKQRRTASRLPGRQDGSLDKA